MHAQDRAEEAGYVSEFDWATAQRLGIVGLTVGELTGLALLKAIKTAKPKGGTTTSVDGAGGTLNAPTTIPYEPVGSMIRQGDSPVCGPACAAMTITDHTGISISLESAIDKFANGIRPSGVNTLELSEVISSAGIKNTLNTTMFPAQLVKALEDGPVIVQVPAGAGRHFFIVDGVKTVDGVNYYMTRDSAEGPRGVRQSILDNAISNGVNAILIGKKL